MGNFRREVVEAVAKALKSYGYTVYLAKHGTHGFYTDGKRVVSFQYDLVSVKYSGNYSTDLPSQTGTGWGIGEYMIVSKDTAKEFVESNAPQWAVRGASRITYTTPEQHLKQYGVSSQYVLFEEQP